MNKFFLANFTLLCQRQYTYQNILKHVSAVSKALLGILFVFRHSRLCDLIIQLLFTPTEWKVKFRRTFLTKTPTRACCTPSVPEPQTDFGKRSKVMQLFVEHIEKFPNSWSFFHITKQSREFIIWRGKWKELSASMLFDSSAGKKSLLGKNKHGATWSGGRWDALKYSFTSLFPLYSGLGTLEVGSKVSGNFY